MSRQFDVHRMVGARDGGPSFLVNLQADFLASYGIVMVAPVWTPSVPRPRELSVPIEIGGNDFFVSILEMAPVRRRQLGPIVANIDQARDRLIRAIDLLFTGV